MAAMTWTVSLVLGVMVASLTAERDAVSEVRVKLSAALRPGEFHRTWQETNREAVLALARFGELDAALALTREVGERGAITLEGSPSDRARKLVVLAVSQGKPGAIFDFYRRRVAIQELLEMGNDRDLDYSTLAPLLEGGGLRFLVPGPWPGNVAAVLAEAGPGADNAVFGRFQDLWNRQGFAVEIPALARALALARHPDTAVTGSLASMAASTPKGTLRRSLLALALAARGDRRADWLGDVVGGLQLLRRQPGEDELLEMLTRMAPRLGCQPALSEVLWARIEDELVTGPNLGALAALSALAPKPMEADRLARLRRAVHDAPAWTSISRGAKMLAIGKLGNSDPQETKEALGLMAFLEDHTDGLGLEFAAEAIVGDAELSQIAFALETGSWRVRVGSLRLLCCTGPRARGLLPGVARLASDDNELVASWAVVARVILSGLDDSGEWALNQADFEELMFQAQNVTDQWLIENPTEEMKEELRALRLRIKELRDAEAAPLPEGE